MLDPDACYAAIQAGDPRHDGLFFTAVKTTRIYCRPICPARTPLRKNVLFYPSAAQAQEAGFRPCLRCRPESAPDSPAWIGSLASVNRALRLIEEGALAEMGVDVLAEKLGVTGRHLRRLFVQHLGVGPSQVEQTRRINLAKALLHETGLTMTQIAFASGFGSLRRFNEAFQALFGRPPTAIRRDAGPPGEAGDGAGADGAPIRLSLAYRPSFDGAARLDGTAASAPLDGGRGQIAFARGPGRTIRLELHDVPIRHLARALAHAKRDILFGEPAPAQPASEPAAARSRATRPARVAPSATPSTREGRQ